jgi:hypothetical protein
MDFMTSHAEKLRKHRENRRGRPCKPDVARNDNGRISQARNPGEAPDLLAKRMRVKLFGGKIEEAGMQQMGTVIGRLWISKELSDQQHGALQRYGELATRYFSSIQAPDSLRSKGGGSAMRIPDDEQDIETRRKWKEATRAIHDAQTYHQGNLLAALSFMVIKDEFHEHMVGDTRIAANALVRYYGLA